MPSSDYNRINNVITSDFAMSATLLELEQVKASLNRHRPSEYYALSRYYYLKSDVSELGEHVYSEKNESNPNLNSVQFISKIRYQVRSHQIDKNDLHLLEEKIENMDRIWAAESYMVLGMAWEVLDQDEKALQMYDLSQQFFLKLLMMEKSLMARFNAVAAESRLFPDKKFLYEYGQLAKSAENLGMKAIEGSALLNLSREFQKMKAYLIALEKIDKAIKLIEETDFGTYQYYMTIAHRCHVYSNLGYTDQAHRDYQEVCCSPFVELQSIREIISEQAKGFENYIPRNGKPISTPQTWVERKFENEIRPDQKNKKYTAMEEKLMKTLADGAKTADVLADILYGDRLPQEVKRSRLKQVLLRLKKKAPNLITRHLGKYQLVDSKS